MSEFCCFALLCYVMLVRIGWWMRVRINYMVLYQRCMAIIISISLFATMLIGNVRAEPNVAEPIQGDFYIVYDNSASTSKYLTEDIFAEIVERLAVMADFNAGSRVIVYPMLPVIITGLRSEASDEPIVIDSYEDIVFLHNIITQDTGFTQFDSVEKAFTDLIELSGAEDKHLFIISDCDFTDPDNINRVTHQINEMLNYAADDPSITIHCLINSFTEPKQGTSRLFLAENGRGCAVFIYGNWAEAADYCIDVGGNTFSQSLLASSSEDTLTVDIPNSADKLVVFADGEDNDGILLTGANGEAVDYYWSNDNRKGSRSVYISLQQGTYTLKCAGAEHVEVYVQLSISIDAEELTDQYVSITDETNDHASSLMDMTTIEDESRTTIVKDILMILVAVLISSFGVWKIMKFRSKKKVFISYRRDGGSHLAGRLSDRLKSRRIKVFLDVESMGSGVFSEQIEQEIERCDAILVILSPKALDFRDEEKDYFRNEIRCAINKEKRIIPVIVDGFEYPDHLEQDLARLQDFEGVLVSDIYFEAVIEKILRLLYDKK